MSQHKYCFVMDASALIDLYKDYPEDRFEGLWNTDLPEIINEDIFKAPNEVFK